MTQRRGHPLLIWFASAAALIALVLGAWVLSRPNVRPTLDRLSDRLGALQASTPDLFRGMRVLAPGELAVGPRVVERSGLELRAPRGRVLSTAPVLTWVLPLGASSASVRIEDEETGEVVFAAEAERDHLALPAQPPVLAAGRRYVWSVTARGTLGELRGSSLVEVASAVRAKRFRAQLEALGLPANTASQPDPIAALLGVHVAIREDLWLEAQRLLGTLGSMDAPEQAHANQVRRLIQARLAGAR